jgi:hypothetical protein
MTLREARTQRMASARAERKEAILKFLDVVQQAEGFQESVYVAGAPLDKEQAGKLMHQIWLAQKHMDLVCSLPVRDSALEFARTLNGCEPAGDRTVSVDSSGPSWRLMTLARLLSHVRRQPAGRIRLVAWR